MQYSKLYVGNLPYSITKDELQSLFAEHGQVQNVTVIEGKGFGFVEMSTAEQAEAAKTALDGQNFKGRTLKIDEAHPPKQRDGSGGGFRGGHEGRGFRGNSSSGGGGFRGNRY